MQRFHKPEDEKRMVLILDPVDYGRGGSHGGAAGAAVTGLSSRLMVEGERCKLGLNEGSLHIA